MFHVIVVDDEWAALKRFERIASEDARLVLEGTFLYAEEALSFVKERPIDIAFLDIEMPEMNGLELAERLMEVDPYIRIIFITAYNQYALEAFRAHAIGYLLKPLDSDEFKEQVDLLSRRYGKRPGPKAKRTLTVRCFGRFAVFSEEESTSVIRWKTAKAEELFALLVHYQGRVRPKENLIDTLWPELEPEKSANLFRVTCTYLRSALAEKGFSEILIRELDGYKINTEMIDCDLFRFRLGTRQELLPDTDWLADLSNLYSGEYLEGKPYDWAAGTRTQMESDFKKIQYCLANDYFCNGFYGKACGALEKILFYDPCDEDAVGRIIQARLRDGDITSAVREYKKYEKALKDELGLDPSEKLREMISGVMT